MPLPRPLTGTTLVDACGLVCCLGYAWLGVLSRKSSDVDLPRYFLILALVWAATLVALAVVRRAESEFSLTRVVLWALAFRLIGIAGAPVLEDDFYRYLWDGRNFAVSGNPYGDRPIDHFLDTDLTEDFEVILDGINHPELPTIYGPVNQFAFLASYVVAPGKLWPLKLLLLLADLATLVILLRFGAGANILLYAWCPLLIQETFFTAHPDSLGIALMLAALESRARGRFSTAASFAALAVGARVFALLLVPFVLFRAPVKSWLAFAATYLGLYLPFWLTGSPGPVSAFSAFAQDWEFNSSGYALLALVLEAPVAKLVAVALFGVFYAAYFHSWWRSERLPPRGDWLYGTFFFLSPVLNPWYLLWLLPFATLFPSRVAVAALWAVSSSYFHGLHLLGSGLLPYHHPPWLRPMEFGVIAVAGLSDWLRKRPPR